MKNTFIKSILLLSIVSMLAVGCNQKNNQEKIAEVESAPATEGQNSTTPAVSPAPEDVKPEGPLPVIEFETMDHDFGAIKEGDIVEYTYKFKNTGEAPLIIQGAQGSCGCTVPNWTKEPIPVGASGAVTAKFDSHGKQDAQNKTVTVTANTWPKQTVLRFKAMVSPKASSDPESKK